MPGNPQLKIQSVHDRYAILRHSLIPPRNSHSPYNLKFVLCFVLNEKYTIRFILPAYILLIKCVVKILKKYSPWLHLVIPKFDNLSQYYVLDQKNIFTTGMTDPFDHMKWINNVAFQVSACKACRIGCLTLCHVN